MFQKWPIRCFSTRFDIPPESVPMEEVPCSILVNNKNWLNKSVYVSTVHVDNIIFLEQSVWLVSPQQDASENTSSYWALLRQLKPNHTWAAQDTHSPLLTVQVKYAWCPTMKSTCSLQAKREREGRRPQPATSSNEIAGSKSLSLRCTCNHSVSFPGYPSGGPSTGPRVLILCII